jgi:predicted phage-related endonuclease
MIHIGASEAADFLGMSSYRSPFGAWAIKVGKAPRQPDTEATELGNLLEAPVLEMFERRHGVKLIRPVPSMFHRSHPWMRATPDALIIRENCSAEFIERWWIEADEVITVDAKTTGLTADIPRFIRDEKWGEQWSDEVPAEYAVQLQQQMLVVGDTKGRCTRGIVTALVAGRGLIDYMLPAVPTFQHHLVETLGAFHAEHFDLMLPPSPQTADDWRCAQAALYTRPARKERIRRAATPDEATEVITYWEARQAEKAAKDKKDIARAKLAKAIGDASSIETESYRATYSDGNKGRALTVKEKK